MTRQKPPVDPQRIGVVGSILTLVAGVVMLNLIASFSQTLAFAVAVAVIAAAAAVFLFTLTRKN
jgi:hypothetical protein